MCQLPLQQQWSNVVTLFTGYFQLLNESTGTLKKNSLKIQAVLYFFCGTIEGNSKIRVVVLLFQWYYWEIFIKLQRQSLEKFICRGENTKIE